MLKLYDHILFLSVHRMNAEGSAMERQIAIVYKQQE